MEKLIKYCNKKGRLSKPINCAEKIPYSAIVSKQKNISKKIEEAKTVGVITDGQTKQFIGESNTDQVFDYK